jgi:hypothetical protein
MKKQILFICAIVFVLSSSMLKSQVALHPTAAFIDPQTRTGSMEIVNTSNKMREIDISFKFGYIMFDEKGVQYTEYEDKEMEEKFSLAPYIKVFPSKLIIPPEQAATVRFMVTGLTQNTENKYIWSRIIVGSVPQVEQIDTTGRDQISAQMILKTEMVGLVGMFKGKSDADLDFAIVDNYSDSVNTTILVKQDKSGDYPFWGRMEMNIFDSEGKEVVNKHQGLAIYKDCVQGIKIPVGRLEKGKKYKAVVEVKNQRDEIPEDYLPELKTKKKEFEFVVN